MSDLADLVPSLKRTIAVPGTFTTLFPSTTDDDLAAVLADGMAEAKLDGWLSDVDVDVDVNITDPDLTVPQQALVVLYASVRILMSEIRNRKTHIRYEAGSATFEQDQSASMLVEQLKILTSRKEYLLTQARRSGYVNTFAMFDSYFARATNQNVQIDKALLDGFSSGVL